MGANYGSQVVQPSRGGDKPRSVGRREKEGPSLEPWDVHRDMVVATVEQLEREPIGQELRVTRCRLRHMGPRQG